MTTVCVVSAGNAVCWALFQLDAIALSGTGVDVLFSLVVKRERLSKTDVAEVTSSICVVAVVVAVEGDLPSRGGAGEGEETCKDCALHFCDLSRMMLCSLGGVCWV